jgi:hypothetical protein
MLRKTLAAFGLTALPAALGLAALLPAIAATDGHFTVTIKNVATDMTLKLPDGSATRAPIAPGAYAVLEPGASAFEPGAPASGEALEHLAEDGNAEPLIDRLKSLPGVREAGLFVPGQPFEVTARPGERLVFLTMFVQSNDLFYAPAEGGIALFDADDKPVAGDATGRVRLWDAGTEVNEAPGAGPNQAPRQAKPDTGPDENGTVHPVADGFNYPEVNQVIAVTIAAD